MRACWSSPRSGSHSTRWLRSNELFRSLASRRPSCKRRADESARSSLAAGMARHKPRPFVDTNVLYSGLYSSRGAPAELLKRHADGKLTIVISRQVLEELVRTVRNKAPQLALL